MRSEAKSAPEAPESQPTFHPSLKEVLRGVRRKRRWTLKQMSERSGIPLSTLSKVESGRLTLSYERLVQLATRLGLNPLDFTAAPTAAAERVVARRSTERWDRAIKSLKSSESLYPMCGELLQKKMNLALIHLSQQDRDRFECEPGGGEAYYLVFDGSISVRTEFYQPEVLNRGDSIYLDTSMRHSFRLAETCDDAFLVRISCGVK